MATHSSTLTWRIPWTEEPGGPRSTGLQSQTRLKQLNLHIQMFVVYPFNFSACLEFFQNKKIVEGTVLK